MTSSKCNHFSKAHFQIPSRWVSWIWGGRQHSVHSNGVQRVLPRRRQSHITMPWWVEAVTKVQGNSGTYETPPCDFSTHGGQEWLLFERKAKMARWGIFPVRMIGTGFKIDRLKKSFGLLLLYECLLSMPLKEWNNRKWVSEFCSISAVNINVLR